MAALLLLALPVSVQPVCARTESSDISINCTSSGQLCDPPYGTTLTVGSTALVGVEYFAPFSHCSTVSVHVSVGGGGATSSGPVPPGASSGFFFLGMLSPGIIH